MDDADFPTDVVDQLDRWVNTLAMPLLPPRIIIETGDQARLEFRWHLPHAVMVGKLVRMVSGFHAALSLADQGYVAECASLLRMVSDFCREVSAIGKALQAGGEPPRAVRDFVAQYFMPRPRTIDQYAAAERIRYVSREELMKTDTSFVKALNVDAQQLRKTRQFLNVIYDAYVHGAYETTMDLYDPLTCAFAMRGHPDAAKRAESIEAAYLKLHEVVVAIELTAAVNSNAEVFEAAREARHRMDASDPWKLSRSEDPCRPG